MLKLFNTCILLTCCSIFNTYAQSKLTDEQILARINNCRPLLGAPIDRNIKNHLGATHVDGKYYLSQEPFLVEGASQLNDLGFGILKVWFRKNGEGYTYHSNWNLDPHIQLAELAQHPYWKTTFTFPFSTFVLSLDGAGITTTDSSAKAEEEEIFRLVTYLLTTYKNRKLTFILQNWEGDWILRGGTGDSAKWSRTPGKLIPSEEGNKYSVAVPKDSLERINALIKWFSARQRGVERARKAVPHSRTTVYHAIEANRVIDCMNGLPGIANQILPNVEVDMVSWSCYDGLDESGLTLYKGIEYLKTVMKPSRLMKNKRVVFLGEIGIPEQWYQDLTEKETITNRWDTYWGVCEVLSVPYCIQWQLYCNEPKLTNTETATTVRSREEMKGFWLVRPDGTKSFAAAYFTALLNKAGSSLKN